MRSKSMKALVSVLLLFPLVSCALLTKKEHDNLTINNVKPGKPFFLPETLLALPFVHNASTLSFFADELCRTYAPLEQKRYACELAHRAFKLDSKSSRVVLTLARCSFMCADITSDTSRMKEYAQMGIKAVEGQKKLLDNPDLAYYYALNLGLIVQARGLFALNKIPIIKKNLEIARKKPGLGMGGPLRVLGMLYLKAPSWPTGIGDLDKALELLDKAVKDYPGHPQNYIFYAEALLQDDEKDAAKKYLLIAQKIAIAELWGQYYSAKWQSEIKELLKKTEK